MISAMYENGGNMTERLLDGHPELFVYPFESQIGTKYVNDFLSGMYPPKYRWPVFPSTLDAAEAYQLIIDEEGKIRSKTPYVSKFRTADFDLEDKNRIQKFISNLKGKPLSRPNFIEAFFRATFDAWKNYKRTGKEKAYVGYSPIIGVDGDKIISDFGENVLVIHVIRNPFSAYADTKKRPVPLSLPHYATGWSTSQYFAKIFAKSYRRRFVIAKFEDIVENPRKTLYSIIKDFGLTDSETLSYPSWNGEKLKEIYPWGTIRTATPASNLAVAKELSKKEIEQVALRTEPYLKEFGYDKFLSKLL
jgi:hypothetical protein